MAKLARVPADHGALEAAGAELHAIRRPHAQYYAFLSYSHKDDELAGWLHRELEEFRVPPALAGRLTANGVIPRRLSPIFRDEHELAAAGDLGEEIREALECSQYLIVLCSPASAASHWTNTEIEAFKRTRPDGCVLAAIAAGEPFASEIPGREGEECFPPALRQKFDRRGRPTGKRAEPLAADLRGDGEARRVGLLKLVAGMLGVGLDDLVQRETTRRQRRLAWLTAASVFGMAVTSGLALTAIHARDSARDQRREAEGLVAFMLGDLKDKLEPIGRLDALDGVGSRVLAYYSKQDTSELSDGALQQRSRALSLMAEVAYLRGDLDGAQRLYREAMDGTAETIRRDPSDPQRLFDHAQNVFWAGDITRQLGQTGEAETAMREYKRLADQMVALGPDNMKWRMEQQNADANLGVLLFEQRHFGEAIAQFNRALTNIQALATADPGNGDYQKSLTESQTWLADSEKAEGQLDQAIALRERHVALVTQLLQRTGDVEYRQKLVSGERYLAELYLFRGQLPNALTHYQAAVSQSDALIAREPGNSRWRYFSARARMDLAQALLNAGQRDLAATEAEAACSVTGRLIATDSNVHRWRANLRDCLGLRAQLAVAHGDLPAAARLAAKAVATGKSVSSTDPVEDRYAVARSFALLGDIHRRLGDRASATAAWEAGLAMISAKVAEKPNEMAEHALLLQRLGRSDEARAARLAGMGYRLQTGSTS
ncbi:MAG TPA: TIR domain-containing protein [Sphingomicrobium sp.]|nr:TIR domain-containing protein [Sphingomicrobium sp.]